MGMLRAPECLRLDDLMNSIREHMSYIGLEALVERVDENKVMITVLEG
jgi:hypothetical protein